MRARYIYEKFTEYSDPIHDLGVGLIHILKDDHRTIGSSIPTVSSEKYFGKKVFGDEMFIIYIFLDTLLYILKRKYLKADHIEQEDIEYAFEKAKEYRLSGRKLKDFVNLKKVKVFLRDHYGFNINDNKFNENLNEKFIEDSDPISDMNIGIKKFLEKEYREEGRTSSSQGSKRFFGTTKYEHEAFFIYVFLGYLLAILESRKKLSEEGVLQAFENTKEYRYAGQPLKHKVDLKKIKEALLKFYNIKINDGVNES